MSFFTSIFISFFAFIIDMENSFTTEYNLDNVYKSFNNVIDKSDDRSIRLHEFIISFRELAK
jgi:hypothetical protein